MGKDVDNLGESVQDAGGTAALPSAAVSPEPEVQPTSLEADDQEESVSERITRIEALVRSIQADKDRGTNKALDGVSVLEGRIAEMEVYSKMRMDGKSKEEAQRELVLEEIVRERMGSQVAQEPVGSRAVEPGGFDADEFLRGQGIDPNSAEALTLIRDDKTSITDYYNFALGKKTAPVTAPNPAQVMPVGSGGVAASPDVLELTARLREYQKEPTKHIKERAQIMEELGKLNPKQ